MCPCEYQSRQPKKGRTQRLKISKSDDARAARVACDGIWGLTEQKTWLDSCKVWRRVRFSLVKLATASDAEEAPT